MSLSGIARITNGLELVRHAREEALKKAKTSTVEASAILVDTCRRLLADRPADLQNALIELGRVQRDLRQVHAIVRETVCPDASPWHPHQIRDGRRRRAPKN